MDRYPLINDEEAQQEVYEFFEEKDNEDLDTKANEYEWQLKQEEKNYQVPDGQQ